MRYPAFLLGVTMAVTNDQRKAAYKYFRQAGFSVKDSRARRNQPLKAYEHYEEYKALMPEDRKLRMPKIPASKTSIKKAKKRLGALGLNKKTINNITRKKDEVLRTTLQLERYFKVLKKSVKGRGAKAKWKTMRNDLLEAMKKKDFWDFMSDAYDYIVGITL